MVAPSQALNGFRPDLGTMFEFDQMANRLGFIGHLIAPVFEAAEQAGTYGLIPLKELLKEPETGRTSSGHYNRTGFEFQDVTYATKEQGIEMPIDRRRAKIYQEFFDFETVCTAYALDIVLRAAERRIASLIFNATTWTSNTTAVSNEWDDATNGTPITDVNAAVLAVRNATGMWPNAIAFDRTVLNNLRMNAQIIEKIASSGAGSSIVPGSITIAQIAACFDLKHVLVAGSARDSANEGQTATIASVWDDEYAMVCRVSETSNIEEPAIARTIHWGEDGSSIGGSIETYYEDQSRGDIVRARHEVQEKVMYMEMGHLLSNITS